MVEAATHVSRTRPRDATLRQYRQRRRAFINSGNHGGRRPASVRKRPLKNGRKSRTLRVEAGRQYDELSFRPAEAPTAMVDDKTLAMLRCPKDHSMLHRAEASLVARLNTAIRAGRLRNQAGQLVEHSIDGGLVRAGGDLLYPIVDEIPVLLYDEAIPLTQLR
jgi:uncharacterized protein YbaR (Trm112 family)